MYFDKNMKLSPVIPKAVRALIDQAEKYYNENKVLEFEQTWDELYYLIRSCYESDIIQGKDYNRIFEIFGKDWWNIDLDSPDLEMKFFGMDTPLGAPIYKELAASDLDRQPLEEA